MLFLARFIKRYKERGIFLKLLKRMALLGCASASLLSAQVYAQTPTAGDIVQQSIGAMSTVDSVKANLLTDVDYYNGGAQEDVNVSVSLQFIESLMNGSLNATLTPSNGSFQFSGQAIVANQLLYINIPIVFGEQLFDISEITREAVQYRELDASSVALLNGLVESMNRLFDVTESQDTYTISLRSNITSKELAAELDRVNADDLIAAYKESGTANEVEDAENTIRQGFAQLREFATHYDEWKVSLQLTFDKATRHLTAISFASQVKNDEHAKENDGIASVNASLVMSDFNQVEEVVLPEHASLLTPQSLNAHD